MACMSTGELFLGRQCENYAIDIMGDFLLYFDDSPLGLEENNEVIGFSITRPGVRPAEDEATERLPHDSPLGLEENNEILVSTHGAL